MKILLAQKKDKKDILRFYKSQYYGARFLGLDHTYFIKDKSRIIASVILSKILPESSYYFLHALVVDGTYRNKGIAKKLLNYVLSKHSPAICFAEPVLSSLYKHAKMLKVSDKLLMNNIPEHLSLRFNVYLKKQPSLQIFLHN